MVDGVVRTVEESVLLPRVTVEIEEHQQVLFLPQPPNKPFDMLYFGVELWFLGEVGAVEVPSRYPGATVAKNHSVWVQHWNDVEVYPRPQGFCLLIVTEQVFHETMQDMGPVALSWMHPTCHHDRLFL